MAVAAVVRVWKASFYMLKNRQTKMQGIIKKSGNYMDDCWIQAFDETDSNVLKKIKVQFKFYSESRLYLIETFNNSFYIPRDCSVYKAVISS